MPALASRQQSLDRLDGVFRKLLERFIPADESVPLRGRVFADFEAQADAFARELVPAFLEELARLDEAASADASAPGRCPHCGSENVRMLAPDGQEERRCVHGTVVLPRQTCRCRPCGRSFSPSGA